MLQEAWPNNPDFDFHNFERNDEMRWCPRMPPATPFPAGMQTTFRWDMRDTCVRMLELQTQIAIRKTMQYKHHLFGYSAIYCPVLYAHCYYPLGPLWVGRCRRKTRHLRWDTSALEIVHSIAVRSVTAKSLAFWLDLDALDINAYISPSKLAKRQFVCQQTS